MWIHSYILCRLWVHWAIAAFYPLLGPYKIFGIYFLLKIRKKNCRSYFVNSPIIEKYLEKNLLYNSKYHTYMTESDIHHWKLLTILTCKLLSWSYEENNEKKLDKKISKLLGSFVHKHYHFIPDYTKAYSLQPLNPFWW